MRTAAGKMHSCGEDVGRREDSSSGKVEKRENSEERGWASEERLHQAVSFCPRPGHGILWKASAVGRGLTGTEGLQLWGGDALGPKPAAGRTVAVRNVSGEHTSIKQFAEQPRGPS